jgi:hypothetical protein
MPVNTKAEIMAAIGRTDDYNLKMVLLLMLGIMEEIGSKIDRIYTDKDALRESVLNGHADVHHGDHEWIKHHRLEDIQRLNVIKRIEPVLLWAEVKIADEKETKTNIKKSITDKIISLGEKIVWALVGMTAYALTHGWGGF